MAHSGRLERTTVFRCVAIALVVVVVCTGLVWIWFATAPKERAASIQIEDSARVLDKQALTSEIEKMDFKQSLRVVVWTRTGDSDENIDSRTLEWAHEHPELELLSDSGKRALDRGESGTTGKSAGKSAGGSDGGSADNSDTTSNSGTSKPSPWADNTVIITLSVEDRQGGHGQVGTYFGQDLALEQERQTSMQKAGTEDFHRGEWTQGVAAVLDHSSDVMGSWTRSDLARTGVSVLGTLVLFCGVVAIVVLTARASSMKRARADFGELTRAINDGVASTPVHPAPGGTGADIAHTARSVQRDYGRAQSAQERIDARGMVASTVLNVKLGKEVAAFHKSTQGLLPQVNMLSRARTLIGRAPGWQRLWDEEIAETRSALQSAANNYELVSHGPANLAEELQNYVRRVLPELEWIRREGLGASPATDISALLDRIVTIRAGLSRRMYAIQAGAWFPRRPEKFHTGINGARTADNARARSVTGVMDADRFFAPGSFSNGVYRAYRGLQWRSSYANFGGSGGGGGGGGGSSSGSSSSF